MNLETVECLVISTLHLEPLTLEILSDVPFQGDVHPFSLWVDSLRYGYLLHVPEDDEGTGGMPEALYDKEDLRQVVDFAREHGFTKVIIDQDGPSIESLKEYE